MSSLSQQLTCDALMRQRHVVYHELQPHDGSGVAELKDWV